MVSKVVSKGLLPNGQHNLVVCSIDDIRKTVDARKTVKAVVYYIDPHAKVMKIFYPITCDDGGSTIGSFLTFASTPNQVDLEYTRHTKIYNFYFPISFLRLRESPACCINGMLRILGRGASGGMVSWWSLTLSEDCNPFWLGVMPPWVYPNLHWIWVNDESDEEVVQEVDQKAEHEFVVFDQEADQEVVVLDQEVDQEVVVDSNTEVDQEAAVDSNTEADEGWVIEEY